MIDYAVSMKYMLSGYTVILIVLALYTISLFLRWRKLKQELNILKDIQNKKP